MGGRLIDDQTMKKRRTLISLLLINFGAFIGAAALLPRRSSWSHSGPVSYFINCRQHWDVAWGILIALLIISAGVFLLMDAKGVFDRTPTDIEENGADR